LYWYTCMLLREDHVGFRCVNHESRPYVCSGYKPYFQGGYLRDKTQIISRECAYYLEWPEPALETLLKEQQGASLSQNGCLQQKIEEVKEALLASQSKEALLDFASPEKRDCVEKESSK